ncbi:MAG: uridylate kinase [Cloacibacillus sp.]
MTTNENQINVVKIGGAPGNSLEPLISEIARRSAAGERWVVAHGASGAMDALCRERGVEIRMVTSPSGYRSRFVGEAERELFREAALSYGARIASMLEERGAAARQMDPEAAPYAEAARKDVIRESVGGRTRLLRGNYSGTVKRINAAPLLEALDAGCVPVVAPLALDETLFVSLNVDGDRLAAQIAAALHAGALFILSNVPGLMKELNDPASLIKNGALSQWEILEHYAQGNMKRKLVACKEALELGTPAVCLADGREAEPIANAIAGNATWLAR